MRYSTHWVVKLQYSLQEWSLTRKIGIWSEVLTYPFYIYIYIYCLMKCTAVQICIKTWWLRLRKELSILQRLPVFQMFLNSNFRFPFGKIACVSKIIALFPAEDNARGCGSTLVSCVIGGAPPFLESDSESVLRSCKTLAESRAWRGGRGPWVPI